MRLKPVDDVHASSLVVLDKGTQQQLVELGREYAVTCRKGARAAPAPRLATAEDLRVRCTGRGFEAGDQRAADEVRERRYYVRGLYDVGSGQDDPGELQYPSTMMTWARRAARRTSRRRMLRKHELFLERLGPAAALRFRWRRGRASIWRWCPR